MSNVYPTLIFFFCLSSFYIFVVLPLFYPLFLLFIHRLLPSPNRPLQQLLRLQSAVRAQHPRGHAGAQPSNLGPRLKACQPDELESG